MTVFDINQFKAVPAIKTETSEPAVGDIWACTWGYGQTNVDFYVVTRVSAHSVWLQAAPSVSVQDNGDMSAYVMPVAQLAAGPIIRRKILRSSIGILAAMNSYAYVKPWDGSPKFTSWCN